MNLLDKVQMKDLDEEQRTLAGLIGIEALRALARNYNGTPICILKIKSLEKPVRDELIRKEFDGKNYRELALKHGLIETRIRNIVIEKVRKIRTRPMDDQISLKGILY